MTDTNDDAPASGSDRMDSEPSSPDIFERIANAHAGLEQMKSEILFPEPPDIMQGFHEQQQWMRQVVNAPDPHWETVKYSRQQADAMTELLATQAREREENERKEAERDAREERALKVAEDALSEARKARIITAWSVAITVVSLIVAVITIFVAG